MEEEEEEEEEGLREKVSIQDWEGCWVVGYTARALRVGPEEEEEERSTWVISEREMVCLWSRLRDRREVDLLSHWEEPSISCLSLYCLVLCS